MDSETPLQKRKNSPVKLEDIYSQNVGIQKQNETIQQQNETTRRQNVIIQQQMETNRQQNETILRQNSEIKSDLQIVKSSIVKLEDNVKLIDKRVVVLEEKVEAIVKNQNATDLKLNAIEQYQKRKCLEIKGVTSQELDSVDDMKSFVINLLMKLKVNVSASQIEKAYKVTIRSAKPPLPLIIVWFNSEEEKIRVMKEKFENEKEKSVKSGIFLNHALTIYALLNKALERVSTRRE